MAGRPRLEGHGAQGLRGAGGLRHTPNPNPNPNPNPSANPNPNPNPKQHSLNRALRVNGTRLRLVTRALDERRFPNGKLWWEWSRGSKADVFLIHCNWVKSNKKGRLRRDNLWFLDEHDQRCQPGFDPFEAGCDRRCVPVKHCAPGVPCAIVHNCAELRGWHPRARQLANCPAEPAASTPARGQHIKNGAHML